MHESLGLNHIEARRVKACFPSTSKMPAEVLGWQWLIKGHRTLAEMVELQNLVTKPEEWLFFHALIGDSW